MNRTRFALGTAGLLALAIAAPVSANPPNLLINPGFEDNVLEGYRHVLGNWVTGVWGVESATIVTGAVGNVSPFDGDNMLCMTDDGLIATQAFQLTRVPNRFHKIIDKGFGEVKLEAWFNSESVAAASAAVQLYFFGEGDRWNNNIGTAHAGLVLPNNPADWNGISLNRMVPPETRWIVSEVLFGNASMGGQPGYVDAVSLMVVPAPASAALMGLAALVAVRRRRA